MLKQINFNGVMKWVLGDVLCAYSDVYLVRFMSEGRVLKGWWRVSECKLPEEFDSAQQETSTGEHETETKETVETPV